MFSKKDIKPGMLVEMLIGKEAILHYVTLCKGGIVLVDKKGYNTNLDFFNDNLGEDRFNNVKINKVYDLSKYAANSLEFSIEHRELLWSREDAVDWNKVEVDTKVLVRYKPYDEWEKRYFAKYIDGNVYVFKEGKTSWNSIGIEHWQETKLWEDNN